MRKRLEHDGWITSSYGKNALAELWAIVRKHDEYNVMMNTSQASTEA